MKYRICLPWNGFFATRVYLWGNLLVRLATQRKSPRKLNSRPLATTCRSVWPRLYLRLLASPFGQGFRVVFIWVSKSNWFCKTKLNSGYFFIQSKLKPKPNSLPSFSIASFLPGYMYVLPSSFDWFTELFVVIGYDDYFDYHQSKPSDNDQLYIREKVE